MRKQTIKVAIYYGLLTQLKPEPYCPINVALAKLLSSYDRSGRNKLRPMIEKIYDIERNALSRDIKIERGIILGMIDQFIEDERQFVRDPIKLNVMNELQNLILADEELQEITPEYLDRSEGINKLINEQI